MFYALENVFVNILCICKNNLYSFAVWSVLQLSVWWLKYSIILYPFWISAYIFPSIIMREALKSLAKTSEIDKYLLLELKGKAFSLSLLSMRLVVSLLYLSLLCWVCFYCTQFLEYFYYKNVIFCQMLFCIYSGDHIIFIFHLINVVYHIYWLAYVALHLHLRNPA